MNAMHTARVGTRPTPTAMIPASRRKAIASHRNPIASGVGLAQALAEEGQGGLLVRVEAAVGGKLGGGVL